MPFIANTDAERAAMLAAVGVERIEDLFQDVPEAYRFPTLDLPESLSELEVVRELTSLSNENENLDELASFLGAGAYRHFIPTVVDFLSGRSEFYSAYTPYQPEVSQGTLQAIFEYQSMIAALTGMEASMPVTTMALRRRPRPSSWRSIQSKVSENGSFCRPRSTRSIARWFAPTPREWDWTS